MTWICPECGKSYRRKNQWHSCYVFDVEDHLYYKPESIRSLLMELLSVLNSFGPIEIYPIKSVIQVRAGATFLSIKLKKDFLELEFQLGKDQHTFPVHQTIRISGKRVLHRMCLDSKEDINDQLIGMLKESYTLVSQASG